jgi:16S rRNA C967 or C1407 C5-methylase (RsmB/RsmF family)/NOL1/NOP2/fmu family ribosome biogenesis protein
MMTAAGPSKWDPLIGKFGFSAYELAALENTLLNYAPRCIRRRPDRESKLLPFDVDPVAWFARGFILSDQSIRPSQFLEYASCDYYIQDAGSMLPLALLDPKPNEWICDLCAAPGGKASGILEMLGPQGWLVANEPIQSRVDILRFALERTGLPWYATTSLDPDRLATLMPAAMDAVLVDAPCTGQALVSHDKRSDNAFASSQIDHSVQRQRRILEAAIRLLRPGGRLIYSTCTFSTAENEDQISWLTQQYPNAFRPMDVPSLHPWASPIALGCYRVWPHRDPSAGAFAAGLELVEELPIVSLSEPNSVRRTWTNKKDQSAKSSWTCFADKDLIEQNFGKLINDQVIQYPWTRLGQEIPAGLATEKLTWPKFYDIKAKNMQPEHALALLGREYFLPDNSHAMDSEQAKLFIDGQSLPICAHPSRWSQATWQDRPLGWMKITATRSNNSLPKIARQSFS